jgi:hypothetical protein
LNDWRLPVAGKMAGFNVEYFPDFSNVRASPDVPVFVKRR